MSQRHYDVIVGGGDIGALACAALLAKRGFRVLVLGCQTPEATYEVAGMTLPRLPGACLFVDSPIVHRVFAELQLRSQLARHCEAQDPLIQLLLPPHRIDVWRDADDLSYELKRVFGAAAAGIEHAQHDMQQLAGSLSEALQRVDPWPTPRFLAARRLPRLLAEMGLEPLRSQERRAASAAGAQGLTRALLATAAFAADLTAGQLHPACRAYLVQAWCTRVQRLPGGLAWLRQLLVDKIVACSGEVRLRDRIEEVGLHAGRVAHVRCYESEEAVGCGHLVAAMPVHRWLPWWRKTGLPAASISRGGMPERSAYRYLLNVVVEASAVPEAMASYALLQDDADSLLVENHPADAAGRRVLSVHALLPSREAEATVAYGAALRQRLLRALQRQLPLLARHTLLIDSPHDGLPSEGPLRRQDAPLEQAWARGWETADLVCRYPRLRHAGVQALSVRTTCKNFCLASVDVAPALGLEGRLLAAWAAAQTITYSDRRRVRMRRGQWTKVEL